MIVCGITGHNGNLGKRFIKLFKIFKYEKFNGDITNKKDVLEWVKNKNFNIVLHFASIVPTKLVSKNYKKALNINYSGTKLLVDALKKYNKKLDWFFFSSTSHVYEKSNIKIKEHHLTKPISKYGLTKLKAEKYIIKELKNTGIRYCIGRIFSIFDNKDKNFLIPNLIYKMKSKKKIIKLKNLNHYRDFLSTEQISKIINFLYKKKYKGIVNIASGQETFLKDIAIQIALKKKKKIIFNDNNKPTKVIANIEKLNKIRGRFKKLNTLNFFN